MNQQKQKSLMDLCKDPGYSIDAVLNYPNVKTIIQNNPQAMASFLKKDSVIASLAEWCISSKYSKKNNYYILSSTAVDVFIDTSMYIFDFTLKNKAFADVLHQFLKSEDSINPKLCGNFSRILASQIRWGKPALFTNYNDTIQCLINRIDINAIQDIISLIVLTCTDETNDVYSILLELSKISSASEMKKCTDAQTCLLQIFTSFSCDSKIFKYFCNKEIINNLLISAILSKSDTMISDLMKMITYIDKCSAGSLIDIDDEKKNILTIRENNITTLSISAIQILHLNVEHIFPLFFSRNANHFLHDKLCQLIDGYDFRTIARIAAIPNFIPKLINSYNTNRWCPHKLKLAVVFCAPIYPSPLVNGYLWKNFVVHQFSPILRILYEEYGGLLPLNDEKQKISYREKAIQKKAMFRYWFGEGDDFL